MTKFVTRLLEPSTLITVEHSGNGWIRIVASRDSDRQVIANISADGKLCLCRMDEAAASRLGLQITNKRLVVLGN